MWRNCDLKWLPAARNWENPFKMTATEILKCVKNNLRCGTTKRSEYLNIGSNIFPFFWHFVVLFEDGRLKTFWSAENGNKRSVVPELFRIWRFEELNAWDNAEKIVLNRICVIFNGLGWVDREFLGGLVLGKEFSASLESTFCSFQQKVYFWEKSLVIIFNKIFECHQKVAQCIIKLLWQVYWNLFSRFFLTQVEVKFADKKKWPV